MASGSRKWQVYTMDSGNTVMKNLDESNGEACGFADYTNSTVLTAEAKEAVSLREMRYITAYKQSDPSVKRKFWVGTPTNGLMSGATSTVDIDGVTWVVSGSVGEKKTFPTGNDTGEDDGDPT